jgi:serine protease Do
MKDSIARRMFAVLLLAGGLGAGAFSLSQAQQPPVDEAVATAENVAASFRHVSQKTLPGVVSVFSRTRGVELTQNQANPLDQANPFEDEIFKRFFGDEGSPFGRQFQFRQMPRTQPQRTGQGSGFVIDAAGIVMTNSHVVNGADQVTIRFEDGTEIKAESWHSDPWSDVAIVRFKPVGNLTALPLGDSNALEVGDWVLALGDPFGVGTSVTAGIISGKGRAPHINEREDFLQTDAAINPGNSGGPLVNLDGKVIGINTAISTRSGGYDGVGFAVPINLARWVADQLIQNGKVARPYLGVMVQPLTSDLRANLGIGYNEGALVVQTTPDGPAEAAGLKAGDVILDVNGEKVASGVKLQGIVERLAINKTYPVHVLRDGEKQTIDVTVKEMPRKFAATLAEESGEEDAPAAEPKSEASADLGLTVSELTADLRKGLRLGNDVQGVVVTDVESNGPAADAGISQGDVIQRVGKSDVSSVDEFHAALQQAKGGNGVLLFVRNAEGSRFLIVHPQAK